MFLEPWLKEGLLLSDGKHLPFFCFTRTILVLLKLSYILTSCLFSETNTFERESTLSSKISIANRKQSQ